MGILAMGLGGLALFGLGMLTNRPALVAPGSLMAGLAGAASMLRCQRMGMLRTRQGLLRRKDNPGMFRFHVSCGWTAILLWTLGGVLCGLGLLPLR
jgi:hypothetical protein